MRLDIMTDIETLGTKSGDTIFQISAIAFDITTGEKKAEFNQIADISKNEKALSVTGSTLQWWLKEDKELFTKLLTSGEKSSEDLLRDFHTWLTGLIKKAGEKNVYLWGNGILFDNKMLQHQMEQLNLTYPIFYRNDRDLRTLLELSSMKKGVSANEIINSFKDKTLKKHDAYDDVVAQINLATGCYNILMEK